MFIFATGKCIDYTIYKTFVGNIKSLKNEGFTSDYWLF